MLTPVRTLRKRDFEGCEAHRRVIPIPGSFAVSPARSHLPARDCLPERVVTSAGLMPGSCGTAPADSAALSGGLEAAGSNSGGNSGSGSGLAGSKEPVEGPGGVVRVRLE